jgi:dihydrodipicolinate synthase/N-acetylneuraminate lyase
MAKKHQGVVVRTVTPLTEALKLDEASVGRIFANFYVHQVQPFILGTTGEAASLRRWVFLRLLSSLMNISGSVLANYWRRNQ